MTLTRTLAASVGLYVLGMVSVAQAQSLGTFRWQLEPFCNVVTFAITQTAGGFRAEGTDDQCGSGSDLASAIGMAFQNPDGTIGFGFSVVTNPGGRAVHVEAEITLASLSGTWKDDAGNAGLFTFRAGAGTGGSPRPIPTSPIPANITLFPTGAFSAAGSLGSDIPAVGPGVRAMWYPGRAAFRVGRAEGGQWNDVNIGQHSMAFGRSTIALGNESTALGNTTQATGGASTALGFFTRATGPISTAIGSLTLAAGGASLAGGLESEATGLTSFGFGTRVSARGESSVALGTRAVAQGNGSFVFADSTDANFAALGPNEFNVRASGGVQIFSNAAASLGVNLPPNATAWGVLSDVRTKHEFRELDGDEVLAKIAAMPVTEWSYKAQAPGVRHIGPTAQDFHAAFGLGEDPLRISTLDADGVALAGVRALEARTRTSSAALAARVETLERQLAEALTALCALASRCP